MAQEFRDSIGLTPTQMNHVRSYRELLENGGSAPTAAALSRKLSDGNDDRKVQRFIDENKPLPQATIDAMVDRYQQNFIDYRAETIARTETLRAVSQSRNLTLQQNITAAGIDPAVVCVDYLGLLKWDGAASASTYERVSETVRSLKGIARQERVVLMNAVQLNRNAASGGTRPTMDMIRDSGAIEEASDRIIALWAPAREPGLNPDKARELRDVVKACLLKNRKGMLGSDAVLTFTRGRRLVETISEGAAA
jgi:hypothetical protein